MKIFIGGEIESSLYDRFRIIRNNILSELSLIDWDITNINELSFYIYLLKGFISKPQNKYIKRYKRIEIEIIIPFVEFEILDSNQQIELLKRGLLDSITQYQNKNIDNISIDIIRHKISTLLHNDSPPF